MVLNNFRKSIYDYDKPNTIDNIQYVYFNSPYFRIFIRKDKIIIVKEYKGLTINRTHNNKEFMTHFDALMNGNKKSYEFIKKDLLFIFFHIRLVLNRQ